MVNANDDCGYHDLGDIYDDRIMEICFHEKMPRTEQSVDCRDSPNRSRVLLCMSA